MFQAVNMSPPETGREKSGSGKAGAVWLRCRGLTDKTARDVARFRYSGKRVVAISRISGRCAGDAGDWDDANEPAGWQKTTTRKEQRGRREAEDNREPRQDAALIKIICNATSGWF